MKRDVVQTLDHVSLLESFIIYKANGHNCKKRFQFLLGNNISIFFFFSLFFTRPISRIHLISTTSHK